jgi:endonuclease/exonuclease/phosphatase family metal-dependent hydrolase
MPERLRVATFNLENLGDEADDAPPLKARVAALRPLLERLDADLICLQEINGQKPDKHAPRRLDALDALLAGTRYAGYERAFSTGPDGVGPQDVHNLVTLSRFPIRERRQIRHDFVAPPLYRAATAAPPPDEPEPIEWDRPILCVAAVLPGGATLHVVNLHLRAPLAAPVPGQKESASRWKSLGGWAEGFLLAAIRRTGQAVEARLAVERIFDAEPDALIVVAGDCNAELAETPLRVLLGDAAEAGNPALASRVLVPAEREASAERQFSLRHRGESLLIDHLLVSQRLAAGLVRAEILNEGLGDDSAAPPAGSFHAPILAEFELPP